MFNSYVSLPEGISLYYWYSSMCFCCPSKVKLRWSAALRSYILDHLHSHRHSETGNRSARYVRWPMCAWWLERWFSKAVPHTEETWRVSQWRKPFFDSENGTQLPLFSENQLVNGCQQWVNDVVYIYIYTWHMLYIYIYIHIYIYTYVIYVYNVLA